MGPSKEKIRESDIGRLQAFQHAMPGGLMRNIGLYKTVESVEQQLTYIQCTDITIAVLQRLFSNDDHHQFIEQKDRSATYLLTLICMKYT